MLCLKQVLLATEVRRPHALVSFDPEEMRFSFTIELSYGPVAAGSIQVRDVAVNDGYFVCFDLLRDGLERHSCRSLLFKCWPKTLEGDLCQRTLPLLPSVEATHTPKPNVAAGILPTVGPLLSLVGENLFPPAERDHALAHFQVQQVLTTRPICTRPIKFVPSPEIGLLPSGLFSPVVSTSLRHGACAMLPHQVAAVFCNCREPPIEPAEEDRRSHPPTLELLQPPTIVISSGEIRAPHASPPAMGRGDSSTPAGSQGPSALAAPTVGHVVQPTAHASSPRKSPRIQQAYDGMRIGSVERASKRKAAAVPANSSSSSGSSKRSGSSLGICKKPKVKAVAEVLELPLQQNPRPLTRAKVRQLARCCDLNADAIILQAGSSFNMNSAAARTTSNDE